jgi:hypothetical protein
MSVDIAMYKDLSWYICECREGKREGGREGGMGVQSVVNRGRMELYC